MEESDFDREMENPAQSQEQTEPAGTTVAKVGSGVGATYTVEGDLQIEKSFVLAAKSEKDLHVVDSMASVCVAGGNMQIDESLCKVAVAGGNLDLDHSFQLLSVTGGNTTAKGSFLGVVIGNQLVVEEGSRVVLTTPQAITLGAALGTALAVVGWLLKRKA